MNRRNVEKMMEGCFLGGDVPIISHAKNQERFVTAEDLRKMVVKEVMEEIG